MSMTSRSPIASLAEEVAGDYSIYSEFTSWRIIISTVSEGIFEMARLVLGITGPIGSGVSTTADAIDSHGFKRLKVSDEIKKEARARHGDEFTRKQLQDIGNEKRAEDAAFWIKCALESSGITQNGVIVDGTSEIVIESIRNTKEVKHLVDLFSPNFFLMAVQASRDVRWNRSKAAYQGHEYGFDVDDQRDSDEDLDNGQQVDWCVQLADYSFVNEHPLGSRNEQKSAIWGQIESDLALMRATHDFDSNANCRAASQMEVHMAVAYAQSFSSACLKRRVGAIIVDQSGIPLSVGFNENPIGMKPCKYQYDHCFKDSEMHRSLEQRKKIFCPGCGTLHETLAEPFRCTQCNDNLKIRIFPSRNMELCTAIHAEERAIRSLGDRSAKGATLYCTTFPCFQCARYIVDAGIKHVVFVEAYPVKQSADFFKLNQVTFAAFNGFKARAFSRVFKQIR